MFHTTMAHIHRRLFGSVAAALLPAALLLWPVSPARAADGPNSARILADLTETVTALAGDIGPRNADDPEPLLRAAQFIEQSLRKRGAKARRWDLVPEPPNPPVLLAAFGPQSLPREPLQSGQRASDASAAKLPPSEGIPQRGSLAAPRSMILFCAHYDTAPGTPGANDNASGVATLLALARLLAKTPPAVPVLLAFVPNEEEPRFLTESSGSVALAAHLAAMGRMPGRVVAVDSVGWSGRDAGWRTALRLSRHDLTVGARPDSAALAKDLERALAGRADADAVVVRDGAFWIDKSDHASFAPYGVQTAILTGSGVLASSCLHEACDSPDKLDYSLMQNAVAGLAAFIRQQPAPR